MVDSIGGTGGGLLLRYPIPQAGQQNGVTTTSPGFCSLLTCGVTSLSFLLQDVVVDVTATPATIALNNSLESFIVWFLARKRID